MSPEPKPRSMAAVTIDFDRCSSENKIWLYAGKSGVSPGTRPRLRAVTNQGCGQSAGKTVIRLQGDPESSETIRQTSLETPKRGEEMVRSAWRHAECGRNARIAVTFRR